MSIAPIFIPLSAEHTVALDWFRSQTLRVIGWPPPLDGLFLANRAKGIHKPAGWKHALSIRLALEGPYHDAYRDDGDVWSIEYSQEGENSDYFTNRALFACMTDGVPIGVLKQIRDTPRSEYCVLGLGYVERFNGKSFLISSRTSLGTDYELQTLFRDFDGLDASDRRQSRERLLSERLGQSDFRGQLMAAYAGRCAISECDISAVLQAAHILCYRGTHTNHVQNGVLLRADLHLLFDAGWVSIGSDYRISIHKSLVGSEYFRFNGKQLRLPLKRQCWPHPEALIRRQNVFKSSRDELVGRTGLEPVTKGL